MPKFIFAYHGGKKPESPEEGMEFMARWRQWSSEHEAAFETKGAPVGMSKTVSANGVADDGGSNPLAGYSVLDVADMEAALEIAKSCPHVEHGTIEVAPLMDMEM
jgi:hypothetical protein